MIATIVRVWPGRVWTTVLARDHADGKVKTCRIWMGEDLGPWMASLCQQATGRVVLTVCPPFEGQMEIQDAELMPEEQIG